MSRRGAESLPSCLSRASYFVNNETNALIHNFNDGKICLHERNIYRKSSNGACLTLVKKRGILDRHFGQGNVDGVHPGPLAIPISLPGN
jgi:hypothetical protein